MIKSILIKNFILIDEMFLEFERGFNVLIGETGAGKSIILKAIDTVMGARVQKDVILNPDKPSLIEITFLHSKKEQDALYDFDLSDETVISREITQSSQKCRVNGALVNLEYIKDLKEHLIDIHSQNQSYTYVQPKYHIELLDAYSKSIDDNFLSLLNDYNESYNEFISISKRLDELRENNSKNLQEIDFLRFQLNEIDSAQILDDEEEKLNSELEVLSNIQELKETTWASYFALGSDDSIIEALSKIKYSVSRAAGFDKKLEEIESTFIEGFENLKYCSDYLREYSQNLEDNPERLNEINERLSLILKLKRKYGDIFQSRAEFQKRLDEISGASYSIDDLEKREKELNIKIKILSSEISDKRQKRAKELSVLIENELKNLELNKAKFEIRINPKTPNNKGVDNVEFMITTNISSPLAPLIKVASGGEISRVMLAIKTIFAKVDSVSTIIFDEIDTGISGRAANAAASSIHKLSDNIQVFAITHQPVIAARADAHFLISKKQGEKTKVSAEKLSAQDDKLKAIASLASGEISEASYSFAKDLLKY